MWTGWSPGARARVREKGHLARDLHKLAPSHGGMGWAREGLDGRTELEPSWEQDFGRRGRCVGGQRAEAGSPGWPWSLECCPEALALIHRAPWKTGGVAWTPCSSPPPAAPLPKPLLGPWFPQRPPLAAGLKDDRSVIDGWWGRRSVF